MDAIETVREQINEHLRQALNAVYVLITRENEDYEDRMVAVLGESGRSRRHSVVTLEQSRGRLRQILLTGPGPSPAAHEFQRNLFPFETASGGGIGEMLAAAYPEKYALIGSKEK